MHRLFVFWNSARSESHTFDIPPIHNERTPWSILHSHPLQPHIGTRRLPLSSIFSSQLALRGPYRPTCPLPFVHHLPTRLVGHRPAASLASVQQPTAKCLRALIKIDRQPRGQNVWSFHRRCQASDRHHPELCLALPLSSTKPNLGRSVFVSAQSSCSGPCRYGLCLF